MKFDGSLDIAIGRSAESKIWKNTKLDWSELVQRLSEEHKTTETFKEYIASTKDEQSKIKDVGGYVGGYLRAGRRKPANVVHRQLLTLDIDFAHLDFWEDYQLLYGNAAILHSTHKHHESSPRFRLVMPVNREVTPDEYIAIARQVAGTLDIDLFDNTTFETNRLMFWPSNPKDIDYYFRFQDGPWLDADEVLATYLDWTDSSLWPTSTKQIDKIKTNASKQEDPENKKGIVGAFCRTYTIQEVIDKYLKDTYVQAADGRYTYTKGSTASGLIIYEDKFAFSHHGTDPCSGKLCNAFDLVRIHKFGHQDGEAGEAGNKAKSFKAMEELAKKDKHVKKIIASENLAEARYDFADDTITFEEDDSDIDWMQELEVDARNKYLSTATNINMIFANDIRLKGLFRQNQFDQKHYVFGTLPWRRIPKPEPLKNVDYSGVRNYIESLYGISGQIKIEDAMNLEFEKNSFHPIKDYLRSLKWDGKKRVDNLLIEYFGAEDNVYTQEAIRKMLVGAVARIFEPGCKFELVLVLVGEQGTYKSSFLKALGKQWFSDTFLTVQGKEALEQIQGAWIIEMAELAGLRKAEVEAVKHFISKQEDTFRPAYGRTSETYLRQNVFFGTTNNVDFLRDPSGNRRFMPILVRKDYVKKNTFKHLVEDEVDQIWAEAVQLYKAKEKLYLSPEAEAIAFGKRIEHSENDERRGIIENYLDTLLPEKWDSMDIEDRRDYLRDPLSARGKTERDFVCIAEIWCECLGKEKDQMDRYKTRELNDIMRSLDRWEQFTSTKNFSIYGKQKYYARRLD